MGSPFTILQIIPALDAGGAERTTVEITKAITDVGGRALVATGGGRLADRVRAAKGEIIELPVGSKNPLTIVQNSRRIAAIVADQGVDILHVRSRAPAWSARWAANRVGVPLVATYHGAYKAGNWAKKFYNSGLLKADIVIANSTFTAQSISKQYRVSSDKITTIPRGADIDHFDPQVISQERRQSLVASWQLETIDPDTLRLLMPGRLTSWKGQLDVVEALGILLKRGVIPANTSHFDAGQTPKIQLVLCGDAQGRAGYEQTLRDQINQCGVGSMTKIVGHCADMPAAYGWADAVIAPSRRPEAFGRVPVEAGAMETPVIAAAHGGALETVIDGQTGWLVPPESPENLADAVEKIVTMPGADRQKMGAAARAHVIENFSINGMCEATLGVYNQLMRRVQ